jgi:PAS domain S-box-containing protein
MKSNQIKQIITSNDQHFDLDNIIDFFHQPLLIIDISSHSIVALNKAAKALDIVRKLPCYSQLYHFSKPCHENGLKCPILEMQMQTTKKPIVITHHYKDKNNLKKTRQIHGYPLYDEKGNLIRIIHYWVECSEKETEIINRHLLDTAIKHSEDSIIITDNKGDIQYVNPAFEKITGYNSNEIIKRGINILEHGERGQPCFKDMRESLEKGITWRGNLINQTKEGSRIEEETIISPVKDANNNIVNFLAIKRDITEKKRLEAIAEASNLMTNLGYVFSGIRHEIGNPVNSIKMTLSVLLKNIDSFSKDQVVEFVERSLSETSRIEYLLKALKNFSLFETPVMKMERIDKFMAGFVALLKKDLEQKGIQLNTEFSSQVKWCYTDLRALHQVMLNLITNSIDSLENQDKKNIKITTKKLPGIVRITVEDTGQGMTNQEKENLFKPFFTSKVHGTGLGLVIVKKMLSKMDSTIKIYSTKEIGTFIMVLIPERKKYAKGPYS